MPKQFIYLLAFLPATLVFSSCSTTKEASGGEAEMADVEQPGQISDPDEQKQARATMAFFEAQSAMLLGNKEKAKKYFKKSLEFDAGNDAAYFKLSQLAAEDNQYQLALDQIGKAISMAPGNTWYRSLKARLYMKVGRYSEALIAYQDLVNRKPDDYKYYMEMAQAYLEMEDYQGAIDTYDKLEKKVGINEELVVQKQRLYMELDMPEQAAAEIQKLIDEDPGAVKYYGMLADIYQSAGMPSRAMDVYNNMLEMDPDNGMVHLSLSKYYYKNGHKDKAYQSLKKAFSAKDLSVDVKVNVLLNLYQLSVNDSTKARQVTELLDTLVAVHPKSARAYSIYGDFMLRKGNIQAARDNYRKAVKYSHDNFKIWNQLLVTAIRLEDYDMVIEDGKECLVLFPTQPSPHLYMGIAYIQQKKYDKAIAQLKTGKELVVDNNGLLAEFFSNLGDAYHFIENHQKSDSSYKNALELNPSNAYVLNNFAYYLSQRGKQLEQAEKMAKRANDIQPDNSSFQDTYGYILYKRDNLQNAKFWLEQAMDNGARGDATVLEHYGDVLYQMGKNAKAIEYWNKALNAGGKSEKLKDKISQAKGNG